MALLRAGSTRVGPARCFLASVVTAACAATPAVAAEAPVAGQPVPGEVIVGFEPGTTGSERSAARRDAGVTAERGSRLDGVQLLKVVPGESADDAVARLERHPNVRFAQPNRWRTAAATTPNDPLFGQLWGLAKIQAPQAWDVFTGADTVVAVVDEGIEYDHPDLAPNMWTNPDDPPGGGDQDGNGFVDDVHGADLFSNDSDPRDVGGHGTHVAGTIAASGNNGLGVTGVNWSARLMAVRVLGPDGADDLTIAEGFDYAADEGARIVNASLGGPGESPLMRAALKRHPDTLFVVAAGNDGDDNDAGANAPCTEDGPDVLNLICVAATTEGDGLASFSNFGASTVDIGAPGTNILSTGLGREPLRDGFEANDFATRWTAFGTGTPWARTNDSPAAGAFAIADSPGTNYQDGSASYVQLTNALDLRGAQDCRVTFRARIAVAANDRFAILRVINNSATAIAATPTGGASTGGTYQSFSFNLQADNTANVRIRFGLESNGSGTAAGADVDDVVITCLRGATGGGALEVLSGTSMASPHVAGAAAFLLGRKPTLTVTELKTALLTTGDPVQALVGKTATGRRLNLDASLRSIAAAEPDPGGGGSTPIGGGTTTGGGGTTTTGDGPTPAPPTTLIRPPARMTVSQIAKQARTTCTRARGTFRCRVTRTTRAVRVRLVLKRRGRTVGRATGISGRRLKLRGAKPRPGRYTLKLTVLENDDKASATKRIRIR